MYVFSKLIFKCPFHCDPFQESQLNQLWRSKINYDYAYSLGTCESHPFFYRLFTTRSMADLQIEVGIISQSSTPTFFFGGGLYIHGKLFLVCTEILCAHVSLAPITV